MIPSITLDREETRLVVRTVYHEGWRTDADTRLGGEWLSMRRAWAFPLAREVDVLATLVEHFGHDGVTPPETVDVLVRVGAGGLDTASSDEVLALGQSLAKRWGRDEPVRLGDGVTLHEGPPFPASGGSTKQPRVAPLDVTRTLLVTEVPVLLAARAIAASPGRYRLHQPDEETRRTLERERHRLLERLGAVEALLRSVA